jgi:hypothetical protein
MSCFTSLRRVELFTHCESNLSARRFSSKRSNSRPSPIRDRIDKLWTCDTPTSEGIGAEIRSKSLTRSLLIRAPSGCHENIAASTTKGHGIGGSTLFLSDLQTKKHQSSTTL